MSSPYLVQQNKQFSYYKNKTDVSKILVIFNSRNQHIYMLFFKIQKINEINIAVDKENKFIIFF